MNISLCTIKDIPDPGSKSFQITNNDKLLDIFVIHKDSKFHAFVNRCPHTGINLEWQEDQFLDIEQNFIQCSSHGALFEIETGNCIHGPCAGDSLTPIDLKIINDVIILQI